MRDGHTLLFIFCILGALILSAGTHKSVSDQQFEYGSRIERYILTAAESPVAFWSTIAAQVAIAIALLVIAVAVAPGTPWANARLKARRERRDARRRSQDAQDKLLRKARQNRKDEKRTRKNRRKRK